MENQVRKRDACMEEYGLRRTTARDMGRRIRWSPMRVPAKPCERTRQQVGQDSCLNVVSFTTTKCKGTDRTLRNGLIVMVLYNGLVRLSGTRWSTVWTFLTQS